MATFEEMEAAWKIQKAKLDQATLELNDLLRRNRISQIKTPLRGLIASLRIEIALCALGTLVMGGFLADHIAQARYVWPAALMDIWFAATLISSIRQLLAARRINYDAPIAGVQEQLTALRVLRLKTFRWLFLSGQIVWWTPFLIIALQMFFGIDAYRYLTPGFICTNLLAGLALIPLLLLVAKRLNLAGRSSWYARLADLIAGQSLAEAQRQATMLAEFLR